MIYRQAAAAMLLTAVLPFTVWGQSITAWVRADGRVVFTNNLTHAPATSPGGPVDRLSALIESVSARHGVDATLVRAMIEVESAFDERAVSSQGALGLMQLMPATGRRFGVTNFFDPAENIEGGIRYLKFLLNMFDGNLDLSLAAYNAGENRVARLGRIPAIPETQNYVQKVRAAYARAGGRRSPLDSAAAVASDSRAEARGEEVSAVPSGATFLRTVDHRGVPRFSSQ